MNVIVASRLSCCSSKQSPNRPTPESMWIVDSRQYPAFSPLDGMEENLRPPSYGCDLPAIWRHAKSVYVTKFARNRFD